MHNSRKLHGGKTHISLHSSETNALCIARHGETARTVHMQQYWPNYCASVSSCDKVPFDKVCQRHWTTKKVRRRANGSCNSILHGPKKPIPVIHKLCGPTTILY